MRKLAAKLAVRGLLFASVPALFARLHRFEWYGGTLRRWVDQLELPDGASILEIGCGPGELTNDLDRRGYRLTGVDRSPSMIRWARRKTNSPEGVSFECADALELPFEAKSFDAVIASSLLNVVTDKQALITEMARVTRINGVVSVLFPTPDFTVQGADAFANRNALGPFQGAAIDIWSARSLKLDCKTAQQIFEAAGLDAGEPAYFLDRMLASIAGRRK